MNGLEPDWHTLLEIFEEFSNAAYRHSRQVAKSYTMHVEEEHVSRRTAVRMETRVDGHH